MSKIEYNNNMKIPIFQIRTDKDDIKSVNKVIERGNFWAIGPEIEEFEQKLEKYIGTKYAVTFNSGTSALHAMLLAYGIGVGDEVIVPSFTFIASANAALFVGANPIFADIENETFGLDIADVRRKISKRTKAIIVVHYGGCPAKYTLELKKLAHERKILLFEDAAESFGASINGKNIGTFGEASILSFCQNKIITTGEGGAVVTNSLQTYHKLKLICSHGRNDKDNYFSTANPADYIALGYNFRMSSMTAALGLSQLKKVDRIINSRHKIAKLYTQKLSSLSNIVPLQVPKSFKNVYQMFTLTVSDGSRNKLKEYLHSRGIQARIYFDCVHLTAFYSGKPGLLPKTEAISKQVLSLPIFPDLTGLQVEYVVNNIKKFYETNK